MGGWQWVMVRRQTTTCLILSILAVAKINAELDFAVHVKEGGEEAAERIARKHGMKNMGEVRAQKIIQICQSISFPPPICYFDWPSLGSQ